MPAGGGGGGGHANVYYIISRPAALDKISIMSTKKTYFDQFNGVNGEGR